jgi:hypothetical protein
MPKILVASSDDKDKGVYWALRQIWSDACRASVHDKEAGWELGETSTFFMGDDVVTEYINEKCHISIKQTSNKGDHCFVMKYDLEREVE